MSSMETDSPVMYHGTSEARFPPEEVKKKQIHLTPEEIRLLRECNKESFYYRCLPFAVAGITATYFAFKQGMIKGHPKWGPAGKMTGVAFASWFIGKLTYRRKCEDKFLKLENSALGDAIRRKRGLSSETFESERHSESFPSEDITLKDGNFSSYDRDNYHSSSGSLNLDVDKNMSYSGLDDRERPSTDRDGSEFSENREPVRKNVSYDEMRRRNREEYERQHQNRSSPSKSASPSSGNSSWGTNEDSPSTRYSSNKFAGDSKNAYGDNWDNPKFS